jgi:hypothetical protein
MTDTYDALEDARKVVKHLALCDPESAAYAVRNMLKRAWDEGWDAGNHYAIDDFDRDYKATNPYRVGAS